jgi:hypothetical protein
MQFLFPNVLWGLLALAIPLIVHLFNFRKTKRVYFSNVALLKTVDTKTSSFRRLKNLLVMLARMLFIACLVLAFAQPIKRSADAVDQPVGINGIYLDNSQSMQNTSQNKRLLDLAVIKIDELLSLLNRTSNVQLSTNDFDGQDQFVSTAAKVKDRLTTVSFSETGRDLGQVYKRQRSIAEKFNPSGRNHFFWFSDFQKSTVGNPAEIKLDSNDILHLIPVEGKSTQNVFVDSVWLNVPFVREMQNNVLNVRVYNSGNKAVEKLPLRLYVDEVQISTSSVDLPANAYGTARFNFTVNSRGLHRGKVTFDDQPITFDNEYFFTLDASPSIRVLHLYGQRSEQNYIGKIFANDSLFNFKAFSVDNFNTGEIQNADLVLLEGVSTVEGERRAALDAFLKEGGNVALIPSSSPSQVSLQGFLGAYGIQNLLVDNHIPKVDGMQEVVQPDRKTPFFEDVFEQGTHNSLMSLPRVYPKMQWTGVAERVLTLKNGKPFLTRTRVGNGNIYVFAAPFVKDYGNFAEHALYVPTFFKMAYLSSKADRLAYNFNEGYLQFYMPNAPKNAVYKLKNKQLELIPAQSMRGKTLILTLPKSSELQDNQLLGSGIYDLEINGKTEKSLALNHSKTESFMDMYTAAELREAFENQSNIKIYDDLSDGSFIQAFRESSMDKPFWKYFIIAALVFLLAEILITRLLKG